MPRIVLVAVTMALLVQSSAAASVVTGTGPNDIGDYETSFRAGPGVANRLTIDQVSRRMITVRELGEPLHARGTCVQIDRHTARCPSGFLDDITVRVGDRGDQVIANPSRHNYPGHFRIYGGSGADRIRAFGADMYVWGKSGDDNVIAKAVWGGRGDDVLATRGDGWTRLGGGRGDDVLRGDRKENTLIGGPGRDKLFGNRGSDYLVDGESDRQASADLFHGGPGEDTVGYPARRRPLRLDLRADGVDASGQDEIRGVEGLIGGWGPDVLIGDGGPNYMRGRGGRDRIAGGGGRDELYGGPSDDIVRGGAGQDVVYGEGGKDVLSGGADDDLLVATEDDEAATKLRLPYYPFRPDTLRCGGGNDRIRADGPDRVFDCEKAYDQAETVAVGVEPVIRDDAAVFTVDCDASPCAVTLRLKGVKSGVAYGIATGRFRGYGAPPPDDELVVPLNAEGRAELRRGAVVQVDIDPVRARRDFRSPWSAGYRLFMRSEPTDD